MKSVKRGVPTAVGVAAAAVGALSVKMRLKFKQPGAAAVVADVAAVGALTGERKSGKESNEQQPQEKDDTASEISVAEAMLTKRKCNPRIWFMGKKFSVSEGQEENAKAALKCARKGVKIWIQEEWKVVMEKILKEFRCGVSHGGHRVASSDVAAERPPGPTIAAVGALAEVTSRPIASSVFYAVVCGGYPCSFVPGFVPDDNERLVSTVATLRNKLRLGKASRNLGGGSCSRVYQMTAAPFSGGSTMQVAVKVVPKLAGTKDSTKNKAVELDSSVAQEIHILTLLAGAPGVVQFLSWTTGYFDVHLAFHMYPCSLHDYIERGALRLASKGEPDMMPGICKQLSLALDHVHGLRIVHRDLKPSNILVDDSEVHDMFSGATQHVSPKVVIADFGGASQVSATTAASFHELSTLRQVTTRVYRAPELFVNLRFCSCTYATDVWAMGVTVVQMDLGDTPFVSEKTVRRTRTRDIFVQMLEVLFQAKADAFDEAVRDDPSVFNSKLASCKLLEADALPWGRSRSVSFRDFMRRFFTPDPPSRPLAGTLARDKALA